MPRASFLDWMKAMGMSVIVYGHVAHATTVGLTPPIYAKQLGVAFFLFATGFTLAREARGPFEVLFNRLFQIYLYGLSLAVVLTTAGFLFGTGLALSNYFPFLGGVNVMFDNFPANPTTWYLGTYLHLLVIWAVWLRTVRVRFWMVAAALALEIPIRALIIAGGGPFIAYMLFTNWSAVFLLGLAQGGRPTVEPRGSAWPYVVALAGGLAVWAGAAAPFGFQDTFPFMTLPGANGLVGAFLISAAASVLYSSAAALLFEAGRRVRPPAAVRFIARNSPVIFLAHMPVFFTLNPILVGWGLSYWSRVAVQLAVCLGGLGLASELLRVVVRPDHLRARVRTALTSPRETRRVGQMRLTS